jgi:hypothetical protein
MSGDINTGMGNCLLMSAMVLSYAESVGLKCRLANNGDDCALVVDKSDLAKVDGITGWFRDLGFDLKVEGFTDVFERIKFCQAQPVLTGSGWRMVRDIFTATSKDLVSLLGITSELEFNHWRRSIATCGLELTRGVPMWESFYQSLHPGVVRGGAAAVEHVYDSGLGYMARGVQASEITPDARVSFWRAFGITPDAQIAYELSPKQLSWSEPQPLMPSSITSEIIGHYATYQEANSV